MNYDFPVEIFGKDCPPKPYNEMRGIKKMDSLIFKGYQLYHNYFRDHDALGMTPAEAANIKIEGRNKWITVIQNASKLTN